MLRTAKRKNEPWFVAKNVCDILQIDDLTAIVNGLSGKEKTKFKLGRQNQHTLINEYGLHKLVSHSQNPEAIAFEHWVIQKVIPNIGKPFK